ncbi:UNVERIFIED_ORG: GntR family transcriptional regulator of arabinose operon [Heyndrickxia coagulans]
MEQQPKYMMVQEKIKDWILKGEVKPGDKIHSENDLVKMFHVSRHTVRQAIGQLVNDGWLYREQGSGTFCADRSLIEEKNNRASRNAKTIGVITTYISEYIFPSILNGIEAYLTEKGYSLVLASTNNNPEKEKQCLETLIRRGVDGLIVEPTKSAGFNPNIYYYMDLERRGIPYVMINQFYQQLNPPHLIVNDEKGSYMVTEHVIQFGHKKIAGLFKTDDLQGVYRMQGFLNAHRDHQIPFAPDLIKTYSTEDLGKMLENLKSELKRAEEMPTAIVCYNDQLAIKVIRILRELGLHIPEDVSIVGFDDSYLATATEVKLTTLTHPKTIMGTDAAKWIVAAIEHKNKESKSDLKNSIIYEPELIVRNSSSYEKNTLQRIDA